MEWHWFETAINVFFIVLFWIWMNDAFERETPYVAYLYLFLSAMNGAAIGARYL